MTATQAVTYLLVSFACGYGGGYILRIARRLGDMASF